MTIDFSRGGDVPDAPGRPPVVIRNLELHLTHSCNLACESCSHYSDQGHKGMLSLEEAERWLRGWNRRIVPVIFSLLGGEPTIHPDLPAFLRLARRSWPSTHVRLVTNGFFLHRHPELPQILGNDPNSCLYLSIHHASPEYRERIRPILDLVDEWVKRHGIRVIYYESYKHWTRRYRGDGATMEPYEDGRRRQSWENCAARFCPQLFEGKLWKCGPLAYLGMQAAKYPLSDKWKPYLAYRPLEPGCSDAELDEFLSRQEERYCEMCPAEPERFALPIPIRTAARS